MANVEHGLHRICHLSESISISDLSDCEDSSDDGILPLPHVNPANVFPQTRPPNFTKSQIRRHFGVADRREIIASTPVYKIRKRKSETPSEKSISLSPIEKNSVQACHIISAKKPKCDDDLTLQAIKNQKNGKLISPARDTEVLYKKRRCSLKKNITNEDELENQIKEITEGNEKIMKEVSHLSPRVILYKQTLNTMKPTVNKSIQLSCKKRRTRKGEQVQSDKLENKAEFCHDLINGEALEENDEEINISGKRLINGEVQEENYDYITIEEINDIKKNKVDNDINMSLNETSSNASVNTNSLEPLLNQVNEDVKKYLVDSNYLLDLLIKNSENLNREKDVDNRRFLPQLLGVEAPQENLLNTLKRINNENSKRNENTLLSVLESPISGKRNQQNKTKELHHSSMKLRPKQLFSLDRKENKEPSDERRIDSSTHNKATEKSVQKSINIDQYSSERNNSEENLKENFPSERNLVERIEDPSFVMGNNTDLNNKTKDMSKGTSKAQMNNTRDEHHTSIKVCSKKLFNLDRKENDEPSNERKNKSSIHKKATEKSVQKSINVDQYSYEKNNSEVNLRENEDASANNETRNITSQRNLVKTIIEDPSFVKGNNTDLNKKTKDMSKATSKAQMNNTREQHHSSMKLRPKKLFSLDKKKNKDERRNDSSAHNKATEKSVQKSINIDQYQRNNSEVNLKEKEDTSSERNLVGTRIDDPLLFKNNNADLTNVNENVRSTSSTKSGNLKKNREKRKSKVTEKEHLNEINVVKSSTKGDKIKQVEKIHETKTKITTKSKINNTSTTIKNNTIRNEKSYTQELPEVRKTISKDIQKKVNKTENIKQTIKKSRKEKNEKNDIKPKPRKSTSNGVKEKYTKILRDLQQHENAVQYYSNNSLSVSTINEDQTTSGERKSTRTRKQTKTFALETLIVTEREFLSYCSMKATGKRSKKSVSKPSDNVQKSLFKAPVALPPASKTKSKKNKSKNSTNTNLPDSGNYSMTPSTFLQIPRPAADGNIEEFLPEDVQESGTFLPPIVEENIDTVANFKNNDNTQKNTNKLHYNLRNKSSEMEAVQCHETNKNVENDNEENHENVDGNCTQTQENYRHKELAHHVDEPLRKVQSSKKNSRSTKKLQLNDAVKEKNIDHETRDKNSQIRNLRTTTCKEPIDKEYSKNKHPETVNAVLDTTEINQSFTTSPPSDNYNELNDICYVVKYCAVKAPWYHKKPELTPVTGQQGIYLGYSIVNRDFGFCTCSTGLMQIDPNCLKKLCYFKTSIAFYHVIEGEAEVILSQRKMQLHADDSFFVPLGQDYSIKNTSNTEKLLLSFTNIKAPRPPT